MLLFTQKIYGHVTRTYDPTIRWVWSAVRIPGQIEGVSKLSAFVTVNDQTLVGYSANYDTKGRTDLNDPARGRLRGPVLDVTDVPQAFYLLMFDDPSHLGPDAVQQRNVLLQRVATWGLANPCPAS